LDGRVLVIGGGNVAIDVARSVRRLGIEKVTMACLESRDTMPAHSWEVHDALEEGIEIINDVTFKRYLDNGHGWVRGVEVQKVRSMAFDREGRLTLDPIEGSDFAIPADRVIVAIGQAPDLSFIGVKTEIAVNRRGLIEVDPETLATALPGVFAGGDVIYEEPHLRVFAGGDVVTGTAFVVDAVAAGHTAAESIERYLEGLPLQRKRTREKPARLTPEEARAKVRRGEVRKQARAISERLPVEQAVRTFTEIDRGLDAEAAAAEAKRCLSCGDCSECLQCLTVCQAHAIDHLLPSEEYRSLEIGAVVLATGLEVFSPESKPEYGYHRYRDVVTSLEFERILSPTGPFGGKVRRPSDGTAPKKVAFIQCVGSREAENNFCSSVCCMYTAKEAVIAREHEPGLECTVFYIDIRSGAKGFEQYIDRAKREGVRYVRCRPSAVRESKADGTLVVEYADDAGQHHEAFDMVVLATAMRPSAASRQLAGSLGVETDEFGFVTNRAFSPSHTSRPGVFVAGPVADPMDIPETVAGASAAASEAMRVLADSRGTMVRPKEYPPEKDVTAEDPKIGVFVCHCGTNIAGTVDVEQVVQYAKTLPNVVHAERNLYTCSDDTQKRIREKIDELGLNRVVVASCTPRTHEALFQETIREAGLNPYYFELANIRDQCSWVHMHQKEAATGKAKDLVRMALAKSRLDAPLHKRPLKVSQAALVIGGGVAGMTAAVQLADQGFQVHLVEKEADLGGHARVPRRLATGEDPRHALWELMARVRMHPRIRLYLSATVAEVQGSLGNFRTTVAFGDSTLEVEHGVVIVATGAERYVPTELLYRKDPRVIRHFEIEELLGEPKARDSVVFVQCVGSRNEERPYCSRTCCLQTVKNAIRLKDKNPDTDVHVLYRDIRTYGKREKYYRQARDKGVKFIRYADGTLPGVAPHNGRLAVSVEDQMTRQTV
ncbi:MAG TPA: FAD-dependent oxidoreductase, partial [Thermoanaerobaculia bacterium]